MLLYCNSNCERGKINLGNLSNIVKYVKGVKKIQFHQESEGEILCLIVKSFDYSEKDEKILLKELKNRLGERIKIKFNYIQAIHNEKSGKFRLVKSNLKF